MILYREQENDLLNNAYIDAARKYNDTCKQTMMLKKPVIPVSSRKVTVGSLLAQIPFISETKNIVDKAMYYDVLNSDSQKITFFAFENDSAELAKRWISKYNDVYFTRQFLKANTLPFSLNPHSLAKRKVKLTTLLDANYVYADGRGKELVFYIQTDELSNYTYPETSVIIKVKTWIETDNGFLYILEKPIIPTIVI